MDKKDYPAAHSMDSCWFGLDSKGDIAVFDTGSYGPIPEGAYSNVDGFYHLMDSLKKDKNGIRHFYLPKNQLNGLLYNHSQEELKSKIESLFMNNYIDYIVLEFKDSNAIKHLSKRGITIKLHSQKEIYFFSDASLDDVYGLSEIGLISAAIFDYSDDKFIASLISSYYYDEEFNGNTDWGSADYKRIISPVNPINIEELPDEVKKLFTYQFPTEFSKKKIIKNGEMKDSED